MPKNNDDKIEIEVEVGDREIEIEIDPKTGTMTVNEENGSTDDAEPDESNEEPKKARRGRGLLFGLVVGGLAGAASASAIVRQLAGAPSNGAQAPQDSPESVSGGILGTIRARWREATMEGHAAAQEAAERKLARYRELTGNDDKRGP